MKGTLKEYMKVGIVHFMAFPSTMRGEGPVADTVKAVLEDDYFDAIEISWVKDPKERARVKAMLAASHATVAYGAQPRLLTQQLDLNSADEASRRRAVDELKLAVDDALDLGANGIAFLSGKYTGENDRSAAMDRLESSISEVCGYAANKGARLTLEVFDKTVDKKCLIGNAADALEIAQRVRRTHENFGLMVDLSHIPLLCESPEEALVPVRDYVTHIHIGNCYTADTASPAYGDQHPRFGYPGGANDVPEIVAFLRVLFQIDYLRGGHCPIVSFEVKPVGDEDPAIVIANAKRALNEAWAKLEL